MWLRNNPKVGASFDLMETEEECALRAWKAFYCQSWAKGTISPVWREQRVVGPLLI